ncbi:MAG: methionine gamma-lyase family protein [Clostridia bacterium]|nr:methionine gamma-lyase family protein [Clostridia bacterium]
MDNPYSIYGVSDEAARLAREAMEAVAPVYKKIDEIREYNQLRVLNAFRECRFSDVHMGSTTGYGYDDIGRDKIEEIFAKVMGAEAAYVRVQMGSGTQAVSAMLFGILRPGDEMLAATGTPYDTLASSIGIGEDNYDGSLKNYGISYDEVDLKPDGSPDIEAILGKIKPNTKMVFIQKSRGYSKRRALTGADIESICTAVKDYASKNNQKIVIAVDNCYGEFVETKEPCALGADICAGSLMKNPGGGICTTGAYVAGNADLVEKVAQRITAPGLGSHVGPTLGFNRMIAQGLFMAPHVVAECLKGAVFAAKCFEMTGLNTSPSFDSDRGDIVQTIIFEDPDKLIKFCQKIQACSPVDSFAAPVPGPMPGYEDEIIMAAGAFVQGATSELSCDGPLKSPYIAYMQGGLVHEQAKLAVMLTLS